MDITIQSVKFDADKKLVEFAENKINKLEKFFDHAVAAEVIMKIDKDHELGNKVVSVRLGVPGDDLFAEFRFKTFEEGIDECVEALKKQIEKHKAKLSK